MKKYLGKMGMTLFVGILCYAGLVVSRDEVWEASGIGWFGKFGAIACVLVCFLTMVLIWSKPKKVNTNNKDA